MQKVVILIILASIIIVMTGLSLWLSNARTLYEGQVNIEPTPLAELRERLESNGCSSQINMQPTHCFYIEKPEGLEIYPHGPGFGPISFLVTEDTLQATKDIPGLPRIAKYKNEVRQDVQDIKNIVTIKEDTWQLTKRTYPIHYIY